MSEPREWWLLLRGKEVDPRDKFERVPLAYENPSEEFKNDNDVSHVIEKSAYNELAAELTREALQKYEAINEKAR